MIKRLRHKHIKYAIMFQIGVETGLRISDILNLTVADIGKSFEVTEKKTKKVRKVKLSKEVKKEVDSYISLYRLKDGDYLMFSGEGRRDKHVSRSQAYRIMRSVASEMGLKSIGTHSMRKTYALNEYKRHGSVNALKKDFGHKDQNTTMAYLVSRKQLDALIGIERE